MIALCAEHHAKADAGAYTVDQLRSFKRDGAERAGEIRGRFDWMRREVLWVVGGNFYFEVPTIFSFRDDPVVWINRDDDGYLLLNLWMLTMSAAPRARIRDNFWFSQGTPEDLESPPHGRLLNVRYWNGDALRVTFLDLASDQVARARWPDAEVASWGLSFPLTAAEIHLRVAGTNIEFGPRYTTLPGVAIRNIFFARSGGGIALG
ncbi:MAG: hypothetical protein QOG06_2147 [Gaiellaceae bacterium]|jgi:hypothetical protein|nr:hypothetical protein [Gaiellaceae bacterium]